MPKPIIIAGGLFPDRHQQLVSVLSTHYEVVMYSPAGDWAGFRHLVSNPSAVSGSNVLEVAELLSVLGEKLDLGSSDVIAASARFIGANWATGQGIRDALGRLVQDHSVAAVLMASDHLGPFRMLVKSAEDLGIPTVFIGHGYYNAHILPSAFENLSIAQLELPVCQYLCLESEHEVEFFRERFALSGVPAPVLKVTGKPFDHRLVEGRRYERRASGEPSIILYCPAWVEAGRVQTILQGELREHMNFIKYCELAKNLKVRFPERSFKFVVKLHPTLVRNLATDTSAYYHRVAAAQGIEIETDTGPIVNWLPRADLVVSYVTSSVSWESVTHGVPVLSHLPEDMRENIDLSQWSQATKLAQWGAQKLVDSAEDALDSAVELLNSKWDGSFEKCILPKIPQTEVHSTSEACDNVLSLINVLFSGSNGVLSDDGSRKLKILQVVHDFPPNSYSGTELYTLNLSRELQLLGHEVIVLHPVRRRDWPSLGFVRTTFEGISVIQFNTYMPNASESWEFLNASFDPPFQALLQQEGFDVVHFQHLYGLSASWLSIAKASGAAVLMKLDDLFFYCPQIHLNHSNGSYCASGPESLDKCYSCVFQDQKKHTPAQEAAAYHYLALRRAYLQNIFTLPDRIHTPSHFVKETHAAFGFHHSDLRVLPTGIKPFERRPKSPAFDRKLRVAFLGALAKRKGIQDFLEAIRLHLAATESRSLSFQIYGKHFNDHIYDYVRRSCQESEDIQYHGSFSPQDLPRIFSEVDLVVIPSIGENYPFIIREAFYAGIPVIATAIAGVPEIVQHGWNGFLYEPGKPSELAGLFTAIAQNHLLFENLKVEAGKVKLASQEAREIEAYYYDLLSNNTRSPHLITKVSIIIPLSEKVDYIRRCLEALSENSPPDLYEVILIDNGSTDGARELLGQLEGDVKVITNDTNLGFSKACNQGAAVAVGEILLFLNNDTEPHPGWLESILRVFDTESNVGAVGSAYLLSNGAIQSAGVMFRDSTEAEHWIASEDVLFQMNENPSRDRQAVSGPCLAIPRSLFKDIAGFDEGFLNGGGEIDLCLRIRKAGYRVLYASDSVLAHCGQPNDGARNLDGASLDRLYERWGLDVLPDSERFREIAEGRDPRYSVVIVTYNSQATIEACILSVLATLGTDDEVIVVDNASGDDTVERVRRFALADPRVKLIASPENLGFSQGTNTGLRQALGRYLVLLNPDTYVTPGWLERMSAHFMASDIGAVGPTSDYVAGLQKIGFYLPQDQINGREPETIAEQLAQRGAPAVETKLLIGFCMMLPREVLEVVGLLDFELFLGNDDLDMSWRLRQKGYRLIVATDVFVHHVGQVSFNTEPSEKTRRLVQESTDALARKLVAHYGVGKVPTAKELWGIEWFHPSPGILEATGITSIVVLTFNQLEVTRLCMDSLFRHTRDFELVVVDNASTDGTVEYLKALAESHDNVRLVLNPSNRGFAGGCNQGIGVATGRDVVLLNNDTVVSEGWLEGLREAAQIEGVGIVGPRTNRIVGPQQWDSPAYDTQSLRGFDEFVRAWRKQSHSIWQTTRVIGFCMYIRREVIETIGGLDTSFGTGNFEDDDYCLRALVAGFDIVVADAVFIHHFGSVTFTGQRIDYRKTLETNWVRFKAKWHLPANLTLEVGYNPSDALLQSFDPLRHVNPLYPLNITAEELPERAEFNIVLANMERALLRHALQAYLEAFTDRDSVALYLLAGEETERAQASVLEILAELGRDPEHIPDITILDRPESPLQLPAYLKAADLVLADDAVAIGARDMGVPAFTEPTAQLLVTARKEFTGLDWTASPVRFEDWQPERWLVTSSDWEASLASFLKAASSQPNIGFYLRVPDRAPETVMEDIAAWLVENGFDPESVPDILVLDGARDDELSVFRFASAWVDTGEARERAIAAAFGLEIKSQLTGLVADTNHGQLS